MPAAQNERSIARSMHLASRIQATYVLVALVCILLPQVALAGCSAVATAPYVATYTPVPPAQIPVEVTVAAVQQGSLTTRDVRLTIAVTITNHTRAPIAIALIGCHYKAIAIELRDARDVSIWHNDAEYIACPLGAGSPRDVWKIAAGASMTQSELATLFNPSNWQNWQPPATPASLDTSATYTLIARVRKWHQGTVDDISRPDVPQGDYVPGQTTIHFQ